MGPIMPTRLAATLFVVGALVLSGCKGPTDPSKNQVQTVGPKTVQPQTADVTVFNVTNTGEFSVKLTALTPGNVFVDIAWGQSPDNVNCQPIQNNPTVSNPSVGRTVLSGSVLIKGLYCVAVFDPYAALGIAPWPVAQTYTVEVSHP